jgi:hypothetical protein
LNATKLSHATSISRARETRAIKVAPRGLRVAFFGNEKIFEENSKTASDGW